MCSEDLRATRLAGAIKEGALGPRSQPGRALVQLIIGRRSRRSLQLTASVVLAVATMVAGAGSAAAAAHQLRPRHLSAPREVGTVTGATATRVTLVLTSSVVTPGELTTITAKVRPGAAGRVVYLRRRHGHRFVNLAATVTTRGGLAIFHHAFSTIGSVILQADVPATATAAGATSAASVETVDSELPFVLAPGTELQAGESGAQITDLQRRLTALGYWIGTPDGYFGDATVQAVYALEKAAGIGRSGIVNAAFVAALNAGVVPTPRTTSGDAIEVNLERDLVLFVVNGALKYTLNTSTGGGYTYVDAGVTSVAVTPRGVYQIQRAIDGIDKDTLGVLWRPRFFTGGYAIHGDSYVPSYPASHGCVRVSNEAINWIWANNLAPFGMKVWVY